MHEINDSFNFSEESWSNPNKESKTKIEQSFPIGNHSLHPIDETDEFHDPFSDLNLFLSKKIQLTVKKHGSAKKWSSQIQDELIKGILPEFKNKFPNYRLGLSALKKVWEKVSYYYGKVCVQKEAIKENGTLNIPYMIKQNLHDYLSEYQVNDSIPTSTAHKLAVKLSECIATLEGERPRVDHLTKTIWAAQKHLVSNLAVKYSKNPFEEYDKIDKLIVKALLEKTSDKSYSYEDLKKSLKRSLTQLYNYVTNHKSQEIYQHIAKKLAEKLYPTREFLNNLDDESMKAIENFVMFQIETLSQASSQSFTETVQRLLAIYPLLINLPKNLDRQIIKQSILYFLSDDSSDTPSPPDINPYLSVFLTTECHFLRRKELFTTYEETENYLTKTIDLAKNLPFIYDEQLEDLEIFIWKIYDTLVKEKNPFENLVKNELSVAILDSKSYSFQNTAYMVLHFFQKAKESFKHLNLNDAQDSEEMERKIEIWSLQNDMLCRYLHFDPNHDILKLIEKTWETANFHSHKDFVDSVVKDYAMEHFTENFCLDGLEKRVWILYKFFWYHNLTLPEETTFLRFVKWHYLQICSEHKDLESKDKLKLLEKSLLEKLPLTPFTKEYLKKVCV